MAHYEPIHPSADDTESIEAEKRYGECWNCRKHFHPVCGVTGVPLTYPIHGCCGYVPNLPDCLLKTMKKKDT